MTNFQKTIIFWASIAIVSAAVLFTGLRTVIHQVEVLKNAEFPELKLSDEELRTLKDSPFYKDVIDNGVSRPASGTEDTGGSILRDGLQDGTSLQ